MARKQETEAEKTLREQRDQREATNAETLRAMNETQPTPTQEENDRAKLGILDIDAKEADGSDEEPDLSGRRTASAETGAPYKTRDSKPA